MSVNSPELEFLNGIFVQVSGLKPESSETRVFVWFSTHVFLFKEILFMHRLEFSCFADFCVCVLKTRVEYGFLAPLVDETVNSMDQKT